MKTLTAALVLFTVFMTFTVEADAGSFNLSGSLDPGFTFGRGHHNRRHRSHEHNEEESDNAEVPAITELPKPNQIHNFGVPEAFTHTGDGNDDGNDEHPPRHHRTHHRSHRH